MPMNHSVRWIAALAIVAVPFPACADGLGGLSAVAFLMFILTAPFALSGIVLAFVLRATKKTRAARIVAGINATVCVILLIFARGVQGRSVFDAFNPWWTSDDAVVVTICLVLIVGNLFYFVRALGGRLAIIAGLLVYLAIQFVGTAGRSIYYEHDPLAGKVTSVRLLDPHHAELQGRVFRYDAEVPCCYTYDRAVVERQTDGSWRIVQARRNNDPREVPRRRIRHESGWEYRFPYQPSHVADVVVTDAVQLDEHWEAADDMLLGVLRINATADWVEHVIKHGADPNFISENEETPLMIAISRYYGYNLAVTLVRSGADPDLRFENGDTMLHRSARELTDASYDVVARLIKLGADPTITNDRGRTPLRTAERSLSTTLPNSSEHRVGERVVELLRSSD
jgi:hypothetical protein